MANLKDLVKYVKLNEIKANPENPRNISKEKFEKLKQSIRDFPEMLELRPIVVDENGIALGGNMRLNALNDLGIKEAPVIVASDLTEEQKKQFIIKDNVGFGQWDWDALANEWDEKELTDWGLDLPIQTETEKLSKLEFKDIYYTPEEKPELSLKSCLDLTKYNAKIEVINNSNLTDEQKNVLKFFAYRFIKIDFENVANYYFFNAEEDEKKIMERLRLVLCDSGLNGFIEDDILKIHGFIEDWNQNDD